MADVAPNIPAPDDNDTVCPERDTDTTPELERTEWTEGNDVHQVIGRDIAVLGNPD